MLSTAFKFRKAFERLEEEDEHYRNYFKEDVDGSGNTRPPKPEDWDNAAVFVQFLEIFKNATVKLCFFNCNFQFIFSSGKYNLFVINCYYIIFEILNSFVKLFDFLISMIFIIIKAIFVSFVCILLGEYYAISIDCEVSRFRFYVECNGKENEDSLINIGVRWKT